MNAKPKLFLTQTGPVLVRRVDCPVIIGHALEFDQALGGAVTRRAVFEEGRRLVAHIELFLGGVGGAVFVADEQGLTHEERRRAHPQMAAALAEHASQLPERMVCVGAQYLATRLLSDPEYLLFGHLKPTQDYPIIRTYYRSHGGPPGASHKGFEVTVKDSDMPWTVSDVIDAAGFIDRIPLPQP